MMSEFRSNNKSLGLGWPLYFLLGKSHVDFPVLELQNQDQESFSKFAIRQRPSKIWAHRQATELIIVFKTGQVSRISA